MLNMTDRSKTYHIEIGQCQMLELKAAVYWIRLTKRIVGLMTFIHSFVSSYFLDQNLMHIGYGVVVFAFCSCQQSGLVSRCNKSKKFIGYAQTDLNSVYDGILCWFNDESMCL